MIPQEAFINHTLKCFNKDTKKIILALLDTEL